MQRLDVWTPVKVTNPDHPRADQAGFVFAANASTHPDEVVVKFDTDGTTESVQLADLQVLRA